MQKNKPIVLSYVSPTAQAAPLLETLGVLYLHDAPNVEAILPDVDVVLCVTPDVNQLRKMRSLRMIQSVAAGVDGLPWQDIPTSVLVCGNAGSNADAVAEHAWALILAQARNLHIHMANVRNGVFDPSLGTRLLTGRSLGIIGMGAIGRRIAEIGKSFGMQILAVTKSGRTSLACDFIGGPAAIDHVLSEGDVIVLTAPLTKWTRGMIDLRRLRLMKKSSILVNIARADLIKRQDLLVFLKANPLFRVATDVWWHAGEQFKHDAEFSRYTNFIGTPWVAGAGPLRNGLVNREVWENMVNAAAANIIAFLRRETPRNIINRTDYI